jgi:hypothetical protein
VLDITSPEKKHIKWARMGDPLAPRYLAQPTLYEPATKNRTKD